MKEHILDRFGYFKLPSIQQFHNSTKITKLSKPAKKNEVWPKEWIEVNYKGYPRFTKIPLSRVFIDSSISLSNVLRQRHSNREFGNIPLSKNKLSTLLFQSAGLKIIGREDRGNRFYPSAGARYPLEIYPIIFNVDGFENGCYHYHLRSNSLEYLWSYPDFKKRVLSYFNQSWVKNSSLLLVVTSIFWRAEIKYGNRSYRNTLIEAGALTQNIYLVSEALNIKCCSIGGFADDGLHDLLDLDGEQEAVVTVMAIGT